MWKFLKKSYMASKVQVHYKQVTILLFFEIVQSATLIESKPSSLNDLQNCFLVLSNVLYELFELQCECCAVQVFATICSTNFRKCIWSLGLQNCGCLSLFSQKKIQKKRPPLKAILDLQFFIVIQLWHHDHEID